MTERERAFQILRRIERESAYASIVLQDESGFVRTLVLGVLRWRSRLDHAIETLAARKLSKLDRQLRPGTRVELELCVEKNPSVAANQIAEATVWLKGRTLHYKEASRDMKASIDELTQKLQRELAELRDKRVAKRRAPVETPLES